MNSEADIDTLARTLYGEARARDADDAAAIAAVVLNRVRQANWPGTVAAVCLQPWQFSCWNPNDPNRQRILAAPAAEPWFRRCRDIAGQAVAGQLADRTRRATHYHALSLKQPPRWARGKAACHRTAGHLFFNDIDTPPPATARQALDQERPLAATRTVKGGQVAAVATAGTAALTGLADAIEQARQSVGGLIDYVEPLRWLFIGLTVAGIGIMLYARWQDRTRGRR